MKMNDPDMVAPHQAWAIIALCCVGWGVPVALGVAIGYLVWG